MTRAALNAWLRQEREALAPYRPQRKTLLRSRRTTYAHTYNPHDMCSAPNMRSANNRGANECLAVYSADRRNGKVQVFKPELPTTPQYTPEQERERAAILGPDFRLNSALIAANRARNGSFYSPARSQGAIAGHIANNY